MRSTSLLRLLSAGLVPLTTLACANYRAEFTPDDGPPSEPSKSKIRVEFEDDCRIFCSTRTQFIEPTSDNEWIVPCDGGDVNLVIKNRGSLVEYRRPDDGANKNELNFSFATKSVTPTPDGGQYFAHNPYCPPPVNGFLVSGPPIAWPGWNGNTCGVKKARRVVM